MSNKLSSATLETQRVQRRRRLTLCGSGWEDFTEGMARTGRLKDGPEFPYELEGRGRYGRGNLPDHRGVGQHSMFGKGQTFWYDCTVGEGVLEQWERILERRQRVGLWSASCVMPRNLAFNPRGFGKVEGWNQIFRENVVMIVEQRLTYFWQSY